MPFWEKEKANNLRNEIKEVQELDNWKAPPPFLHSVFFSGRFKKSQKNIKSGVQKSSLLGASYGAQRWQSLSWSGRVFGSKGPLAEVLTCIHGACVGLKLPM